MDFIDRPGSSGASALKKRSRSQLVNAAEFSSSGGEPGTVALSMLAPPLGGGGGPAPSAAPGGGAASAATSTARGARAATQQLLRSAPPPRERAADWAVVALAAVALVASEAARPPAPYLMKAQLPDLAWPLLPNSVPTWAVPVIALLLPAALLFAYCAAFRLPREEIHCLLLGLFVSVAVTGAITNVVKVAVHRPRPNFVARCWPDGKVAWATENEFGGIPQCSGPAASVAEGLKSFPSGHSSWSAAGLGFLSWALLDWLQPMDGGGHAWRLAAAVAPALGALAVGLSRVVDHWHHPSDVTAGLALGFALSWAAYACCGRQRGGLGAGNAGSGNGLYYAGAALAPGEEEEYSSRPLLARAMAGAGLGGGGAGGGGAGGPAQLLPV